MRQSHLLKGASSGQNDTRARKMGNNMKRGTSLSQISDDALEEILSCLSATDISVSNCVCKKWNGIMSQKSFIHRHVRRPGSISSLFLQQHEETGNRVKPVLHFPLATKNPKIQTKVLDFLPEKVYVMSSNNGLLCCRSLVPINILDRPGGAVRGSIHYGGWNNPKIYICNPISKKFIAINPSPGRVGINVGFAFDPVSCSFHLVTIDWHKQLDLSWQYSFTVFSSKTWSWRISDPAFIWDSPIHRNKSVFVNGIFHWLAMNHRVITFDHEKETVLVVNLPGPIVEGEGYQGVCIGSSGERLVYVVVHPLEFRVWVLKDYGKSEWFVENWLPLDQFYEENKSLLRRQVFFLLTKDKNNPETQMNGSVIPLAFGEGVLYMVMNRFMYSYDFKTRNLKKHFIMVGMTSCMSLSPTIVPFAANLMAMRFRRTKPITGNNGVDG